MGKRKAYYNIMIQKFTPRKHWVSLEVKDKFSIKAKNLKKLRKFLATLED